jgi:NhaA family Na+:H+ antiporter
VRRTVDRAFVQYVRDFIQTESAGGVLLILAAGAALVWANVSATSYASVWATPLHVRVNGLSLELDFREWINDAAMALFFFVVGLEIKRELVDGELREARRAALPIFAALGGMVVPAVIYWGFTRDGPTVRGWGIPMATDIAFAVGVLSLLGSRVPAGLKVFLLSVAIVDDIGAIAVIAVFYSGGIGLTSLGAALITLLAYRLSWRMAKGLPRTAMLLMLSVVVWLLVHASGVHATIAGVALAFLVPATPGEDASPAEELSHSLHPWSSFVVVPIFALANAGVVFEANAMNEPVSRQTLLGVLFGLVCGKVLGIAGSAFLVTRLGLARRSDEVAWLHILGAAALGGIGFTVALFITELALGESSEAAAAKVGIFGASAVASGLGALLLLLAPTSQAPARFVGGR